MTTKNETCLSVDVDYSRSLVAMIRQAAFDKINKAINARNFPLVERGYREVDILLIQFDLPVAPLQAVLLTKERGYRPATIEELLAIGSQYPDLQRSIPIVALGAARVVENRRYVACLGGSQAARELGLVVIYRRWSIYYRFAFVKSKLAI